jgi:NhaA family Na+:H+ antiporter
MTANTATAPLMVPRSDSRPSVRAFRFVLNHFLLLPIGAAIALLWANLDGEAYFRFAHAWAWPVNEIGMAFFLALVAQEVFEVVMPGGALHSWRAWTLPMAGALGGTVGAALFFAAFVGLVHEGPLMAAWPVACAIDLAAAYYVLRLIYPRRSLPLAFVLVLAVVTDAFIITAVTLTSPNFDFSLSGLYLLLLMLAVAALLRQRKVESFWAYWLGCAPLSWFALYLMGIHPALALVPIVPLLPHAARKLDAFADRPDSQGLHYAEHQWNGVAQVALFLFGLVNAGVILRHYDNGTWAVVIAALVGRPLGVIGGVALGVAAGLRLPRNLRWRDLVVIALATTSGFAFALFVTTIVLPIGAVNGQVTLGALSTAAGAVVTGAVAWLAGVGRFAARKKVA